MYIREYASQTHGKRAVVMADSGESLTYFELEARANQTARLFRRQQLARGDHMALLMENSIQFFEIIAAASRTGLYYTPISTHLKAAEVAYVVNDSRARTVVTTASLLSVALAAVTDCLNVEHWLVIGVEDPPPPFVRYEELVATESTTPLSDEQLGLAMIYSSGTTGRPKGILRPLPEGAPSQVSDSVRMGKGLMKFREGMTFLSVAPLYHSSPHAGVVAALQLGAETVVMTRFDPEDCLRLVEKYRVTHVQMVPTMFVRLLRLPDSVRCGYDLSSLEAVVHSAAPCPVAVKQAMIDWLGLIIYEYYGATESYGFTRCSPQEWLSHRGSVGKAVLGKILILDDSGVALPTGEVGNVYFTGGSQFSYFGEVENDENAGVPDGARTVGDVGWIDEEGYLYLTDRKSFMIISGGVNIYPQEVEDVLSANEAVLDVAVFGVPDDEFGEQVKAVVVLSEGFSPGRSTEEALVAYCRERLSGFKCPRSVDFVKELPRLESGKLAKHLIRKPYWVERLSLADDQHKGDTNDETIQSRGARAGGVNS
jgi:long-chain acyl-CoA synthetase